MSGIITVGIDPGSTHQGISVLKLDEIGPGEFSRTIRMASFKIAKCDSYDDFLKAVELGVKEHTFWKRFLKICTSGTPAYKIKVGIEKSNGYFRVPGMTDPVPFSRYWRRYIEEAIGLTTDVRYLDPPRWRRKLFKEASTKRIGFDHAAFMYLQELYGRRPRTIHAAEAACIATLVAIESGITIPQIRL